MKQLSKSIFLVFTLLFSITSFAQKQPAWKEMMDFHAVMSKSFHPTEEGNFAPLKQNAAQLVLKAQAWANAKVPEGYNKDITAPILATLIDKCKTIESAVKAKKSDNELKPLIEQAHDVFHEIKEKCSKPTSEEH